MADGSTKAIKDVSVGDRVLARNPITGEHGARRVQHLWPHHDDLTRLGIDGGSVVTTEDHPYWNATDHAWEEIQDFDEGDKVLTANGRLVAVDGLDFATTHRAAAYNLTVAGIHTYYVVAGHHTILVHNCGKANITESGLAHSFDRHAEQWFGGQPTKGALMGEWQSLVERAAGSSKVVPWSSGDRLTNAYLARIEGKYFAAQFDRETGDLVTAFVPGNDQLGAMLGLLGK